MEWIKQSLQNRNHFALHNRLGPWLAFLGQRNYKFIEAEEGSRIMYVIQMEIWNELGTTGGVGGSRILHVILETTGGVEGSRILHEFGFTLNILPLQAK